MTKKFFSISILIIVIISLASQLPAFESLSGKSPRLSNLAGGKIDILSFALYPAQYDSIELANRIDAKINAVFLGSSYYPDDFDRKVIYWTKVRVTETAMTQDALNALSKNYEVIIIGAKPEWKSYPEIVRSAIINKIKQGTSAIVFSPTQDFLNDLDKYGVKIEPDDLTLDKFSPIKENSLYSAKYYQFSKGKIVILNNPISNEQGYLISSSMTKMYDEFKYNRIANIIYKIAKKSDGVIEKVDVTSNKTCKLIMKPSNQIEEIKYVIRDEDYKLVKEKYVKVIQDKTQVAFDIPVLANGEYLLEFSAFANSKLTDWISAPIKINYNPSIKTSVISKDELKEGEALSLDISYEGNTKDISLKLDFEDTFGRIYFTKVYNPTPKKIDMTTPYGSMSLLNFIKISLYRNGKLLDKRSTEFVQINKAIDSDFYVLLWAGKGSDVKGRRYNDMLFNYGITGLANTAFDQNAARTFALSNLRSIPYTTYIWQILIDDNLFNDEWIKSMNDRATSTAHAFRKYGRLGYTLGDEISMGIGDKKGRFSNSPKVMQAFRDYLKRIYPNIDSLNSQWGKSYKFFDEITFSSDEELLGNKNNPSAWVDYRMFITNSFVKLQYNFRDTVRSIDPGAKVGYDGAEQYSSYDGYDWYQFCKGFDINNVYSQYIVKDGYPSKMFNGMCMRSFTDKDNLRGAWVNGIDPEYGMKYSAWYLALSGYNSVWWWTGAALGPEVDAFDVDLKPSSIFKEILEPAREIQQGIASIIKHADADQSPIAIHYSENNWHASMLSSGSGNHVNYLGLKSDNWFKIPMLSDPAMQFLIKDVEPAGHYAVAVKNFATLFQDLGYQPSMVAKQEIQEGKLNLGGYKVFVLPFVESLSSKEIEEIYKFVENGGIVIADYRTAIRDEHGKILDKSPLDKLFGIERASFDVKKKINTMQFDDLPRSMVYGQINGLFFHPNIKVTTGVSYGNNEDGVPVFIFNNYGKGKAIFLNTDLYSYFDARRLGTEGEYREIFRRLLKYDADVSPKYEVKMNGGFTPHTEVFSYSDAEINYIGVIRDFSAYNRSDFKVNLPLDKKSYIYDVRKKAYLGYSDAAEFELKTGDAVVLAAVPYKIDSINISGQSTISKGNSIGFDFAVKSSTATAVNNHVVNIKVYDSKNILRTYLDKNLYLKNGTGSYYVPIALNDPAGEWKIIAQEVVSGKTSVFKFKVK